MSAKSFNFLIRVFLILICHALIAFGQSKQIEKLRGTLVVAVPINDGLVACADKRLYNADAGTATDDFVKIRKAGTRALFAATNTVGSTIARAAKWRSTHSRSRRITQTRTLSRLRKSFGMG
jgi:hypothetical protein